MTWYELNWFANSLVDRVGTIVQNIETGSHKAGAGTGCEYAESLEWQAMKQIVDIAKPVQG